MSRSNLYWPLQIGGWLFFVLLNIFYINFTGVLNVSIALDLFFVFFFGVIYSHIFRAIIIRKDLFSLSPIALVPLTMILILLLATLHYFTRLFLEDLLWPGPSLLSDLEAKPVILNILKVYFQFFLWTLIYFLIHYIRDYKKAEIENLKWQASINEIELNKLKSQLNPHFVFNSMNSIRALVDEDPSKAKDAITQLSGILRNTLLMGKKKLIPFREEMNIVRDYLALESARFEERLRYRISIGDGSENFEIPPLMLQTIVENGIKHGISTLTQGGELSMITTVSSNGKTEAPRLQIEIRNSGSLTETKNENGFGIRNTIQRLELLFGRSAQFHIRAENNNTVLAILILPKTGIQ